MITTAKYEFKSVRYIQDKIIPYNTRLRLNFEFNSDSDEDIEVALSKLELFVEQILDNSVLLKYSNSMAHRAITDDEGAIPFDIFPINLWDEPVDTVLGVALLSKFNAISGESLLIHSLIIDSDDGINLEHDIGLDDLDEMNIPSIKETFKDYAVSDTYWWQRGDGSCFDVPTDDPEKAAFIGIDFDESIMFEETAIQFLVDSLKDEDFGSYDPEEEGKIVKLTPTILKGGDQDDD